MLKWGPLLEFSLGFEGGLMRGASFLGLEWRFRSESVESSSELESSLGGPPGGMAACLFVGLCPPFEFLSPLDLFWNGLESLSEGYHGSLGP